MSPVPAHAYLRRSLTCAAVFALAATVSSLIPALTPIAQVGPATGVAVVWLRRPSTTPRLALDGLVIALLAVADRLLAGNPPVRAVVLGLSTLAAAAAAATVLRQVPGARAGLETFTDGVRLATAAAAGGLASGVTVALGATVIGEPVLRGEAPLVLVRDVLGCILVLGVQMGYRSWRRPADMRGWRRGLALEMTVTTAAYAAGLAVAPWVSAPFVALPVTTWVAFRSGPFRAALHAAWVALLTVGLATVPHGPFASRSDVDAYLVGQAFVGVVWLVSIGIALVRHEQQVASAEAEHAAEMLRRTIDNAVVAHLTVTTTGGDVAIAHANPAAHRLLRSGDLARASWLDVVAPAERDRVRAGIEEIEAGARDVWVGEVEHVLPDGTQLWVLVTVADLEADTEGRAWHVVQLMDVTAEHRLREELAYRVVHDELTGLATRELLHQRIADALDAEGTLLLFVDLDDFKEINDTLGHQVGDAVLRVVAARLRGAARPGDTVSRLGGDEFVVCCPGAAAVAAADAITRRVREAFTEPVAVGGRVVEVRASVGHATADPGADLEEVLRAADAAMYEVKRTRAGAEG